MTKKKKKKKKWITDEIKEEIKKDSNENTMIQKCRDAARAV